MDISLDYLKYRDEYESIETANRYFKLPRRHDVTADLVVGALESFYNRNISKNKEPAFDHLLDVGCASGKQTIEFRKFFHRITAVDPSDVQIEMAKRSFSDADTVNFLVASAEDIPVDDATADVITVIWSFIHFDMIKFVMECHRLLKPRGAVVLFGYYTSKIEAGSKFRTGKVEEDATKLWESTCSRMSQYALEIGHPQWHFFDRYQKFYDDIKDINKSIDDSKKFEIELTLSGMKNFVSAIPFFTYPKSRDFLEEFSKALKDQWQVQNIADDEVFLRLTNDVVIITLSK